MSKLISFALTILILATLAIAKPKQPDFSLVKEQLRAELHEDNADDLKWALVVMVALFSLYVIVATARREREYKEACKEAKDASKDARDALKDARDASRDAVGYADKMRDKFESLKETFDEKMEGIVNKKIKEIDNMANVELDKIRKQGNEVKSEVAEEAERERRIGELWGEAIRAIESKEYSEAAAKFKMIIELKPDYDEAYRGWGLTFARISKLEGGDNQLLENAIAKFTKAVEINPDAHAAYVNWGMALGKMSDLKGGNKGLLEESITKFKKSIEIKPDYHLAYNNWGVVLLRMSTLNDGDKGLLKEAEELLLKGERIKRGSCAYNLARVSCRMDDEEGCKNWLKLAEEEGRLPTIDIAMKDVDLGKVKDKEWFKELKWPTSK